MQKNSHARVIRFSRAQTSFLCACKSHQENQCKKPWKITIFTDDCTIFQILSWWVLHEPFMLNMGRKSTERFGNLSLEKYGILTNKICVSVRMCLRKLVPMRTRMWRMKRRCMCVPAGYPSHASSTPFTTRRSSSSGSTRYVRFLSHAAWVCVWFPTL